MKSTSITSHKARGLLPDRLAELFSARRWAICLCVIAWTMLGCATLPKVRHKQHAFPKEAFIGKPDRPHQLVGQVRTRVSYPTLDMDSDEDKLCANYFNKAVVDLVRRARDNGAQAVIEVHSVVFLADGRSERFPRAECTDEGDEGEVLAEGLAVKWVEDPLKPARGASR